MKSIYIPLNKHKPDGIYEFVKPEESEVVYGIIHYVVGEKITLLYDNWGILEKDLICRINGKEVTIHVPIIDMQMDHGTRTRHKTKMCISFGDIVVDNDDPDLEPIKELSNTTVYLPMTDYNIDLFFIPMDRFYKAK